MLQNYITLRANTYYFRYKFPVDLANVFGKLEFVRSLKTKVLSIASHRANQFFRLIERIKTARTEYQMRILDEENYSQILNELKLALYQEYQNNPPQQPFVVDELDKRVEDISYSINQLEKQQRTQAGTVSLIHGKAEMLLYNLPDLLEKLHVELDYTKRESLELERDFRSLSIPILKMELDKLTGNTSTEKIATEPESVGAILFSELSKLHMQHVTNAGRVTPKTLFAKQRTAEMANNLLSFTVGDKAIQSITTIDLEKALHLYMKTPKLNVLPYKQMDVIEILKLSDSGSIDDGDLITQSHAEKVKKYYSEVFNYAISDNLLTHNPADRIKIKFESNSWGRYSDEDLTKIKKALLVQPDTGYKWAILTLMYTGARAKEIWSLRKEFVLFDEKENIHYLKISDKYGSVKTKASLRDIPIHSDLIELGFLDYVNRQQNERVFPEVKSTEAMLHYFNQIKSSLGIADLDNNDRKKVLHSFRHTMTTKLTEEGVTLSQIQSLLIGRTLSG